jgi:hypothetical protein
MVTALALARPQRGGPAQLRARRAVSDAPPPGKLPQAKRHG